MAAPATVDIKLHDKQLEALNSSATEILYGGAAAGGKSHLMRAAAIRWASTIAGLQVYLFRRTKDDLVKNHVEGPKGLRAMLAPWVQHRFVEIVEDEIRFWNGSKIYLCHCKDEKHRHKYLGAEIHVLLIDELTTFTEVIYRFLRGRVRAVGLPEVPKQWTGRFPRILASSNPGGVGHHWVKRAFVDHGEGAHQTEDSEGGMLRQFIRARLDDNPSMLQDDPQYRVRLRGLGSEALVRAMEEGDWDVVEGAYFDTWRPARHVFRPMKLPEHWLRFRSFDWGSARPFSVGWWAHATETYQDKATEQIVPKGALVRYREWYGAKEPNVGLKMTGEEVARGILERTPKSEKIDYTIVDPSVFIADGGPSIAERFMSEGVPVRPGDNKRIAGWEQVRARLEGEDERPQLYVFSTCRDTIRTLPALQHDDFRPEDLDTDMEDHAADEIRYACMSRPYALPLPAEVEPRFQMTFDELRDLGRKQRKAGYV